MYFVGYFEVDVKAVKMLKKETLSYDTILIIYFLMYINN